MVDTYFPDSDVAKLLKVGQFNPNYVPGAPSSSPGGEYIDVDTTNRKDRDAMR